MPIFVYSFFMNIVAASAIFVNPLRASQADLGTMVVVGQMMLFGTTYMISGMLCSRIVTEKNYSSFISYGAFCSSAGCIGCILFPQVFMMFVWICFISIGMASFSIGFQVSLKNGKMQNRNIAASTGFYIISFSMGHGVAPAIGGVVMDFFRWEYCYAYCAFLAALTGLVYLIKNEKPAKIEQEKNDQISILTNRYPKTHKCQSGLGRLGNRLKYHNGDVWFFQLLFSLARSTSGV